MQEQRASRIELIPRSSNWWLDSDIDTLELPIDLPATKETARLYWLLHPSRPDAVKIVTADDTEVTYDSYDYAAEQLGVEVTAGPDVTDQAKRILAKVGRNLF
jgi:hypothetical protein